jgi:DNA-binding SARP family transcriptional activator
MHLARFQAKQPLQPNRLRIHLLGPMLVWRPDGTMVEGSLWQRVKVRALLVYLALQRGPVSREILVDVLWPDLDYAAGLRNLNTTVYNLRRSLEPTLSKGSESQFIAYQSGHYLLDGHAAHWLDVDAFEKGINEARTERDPQNAIKIYEDTLSLYRGEYLLDLGNTQISSTGEQHRFYERYLSGLEELAMLYEQTYQDEAAKDIYLKIMAIDPCRESACQKLMRLLLRYDNMAEAAVHCSRLNEALRLELDMVPSPETRRLCKMAKCEM